MITILYDMTLVYLEDAKEAMELQQKKEFVQEIHYAQDCLMELIGSLNMKYERHRHCMHYICIYIKNWRVPLFPLRRNRFHSL